MNRAIVVGSEGQDGRILFDRLAKDGRAVWGLGRGKVRATADPGIAPVDILDAAAVAALLTRIQPEEIYYLAAHHHSSEDRGVAGSLDLFRHSFAVHVTGLLHFLEAAASHAPAARVFYAASSHVFGPGGPDPQDERTPFTPHCIYGITKVAGVHCCRFYRERFGLPVSVGILYNHESPLRRPGFLAHKLVHAALAIRAGRQDKLLLGDPDAEVDWGYAPDYVDAMVRILALPEPEDFIVATGRPHRVIDFAQAAFAAVGLDAKDYVQRDPSVLEKRARGALVGNAAKLRAKTGWQPSVTFEEMVRLLVQAQERATDAS